jgi:hypothetical protein
MKVGTSALTYLSKSATSQSSLVFIKSETNTFSRSLSSSALSVQFYCEVSLGDYNFEGPTALYHNLSTALKNSVADKSFDAYLSNAAVTYDSTALTNATASSVNTTSLNVMEPTRSPTKRSKTDDDANDDNKSGGLPEYAIIIIVVVGAFVVGIVLFFILRSLFCASRTATRPPGERSAHDVL